MSLKLETHAYRSTRNTCWETIRFRSSPVFSYWRLKGSISKQPGRPWNYGGGPPCCLVECSPSIHVTEKEQAIIQLENSIVNNLYRQSQARVGSTHHRMAGFRRKLPRRSSVTITHVQKHVKSTVALHRRDSGLILGILHAQNYSVFMKYFNALI